MRRDLVYFYDRPLGAVFDAFVQAANRKFGKNCKIEQNRTISFALNYSFKYNMNGGSVTARFMPYQNGTAVNLRYSIVQLFGARYKAHAQDLTMFVNGLLQTAGSLIQLDVQQFLAYEQQAGPAGPVFVQSAQNPYIPQQQMQQPMPPQAVPPQAVPPQGSIPCSQCGAVNNARAKFCVRCGREMQQSFCPRCGAMPEGTEAFCVRCGNKLR